MFYYAKIVNGVVDFMFSCSKELKKIPVGFILLSKEDFEVIKSAYEETEDGAENE